MARKALEQYIEQYGEVEGLKKYKNCQYSLKWHKAHREQRNKVQMKYEMKKYYEDPKSYKNKKPYVLPLVHCRMWQYKKTHTECQCCGSTNSLEVHHIIPITKENYKEAREFDNLILLCHDCHWKVHYGTWSNDPDLEIKLKKFKERVDGSNSNNGL